MTSYLEELLWEEFKVKCMHVSNAALLSYDVITNFADEEKYIWRAHWSLAKVFYIASRYFAFAEVILYLRLNFSADIDAHECHRTFVPIPYFITVGVLCSEAIMIMRTFVIYSRSRTILAYLVILRMGTVIPSLIVINQWNVGMKFAISPVPRFLSCIPLPDFKVQLWLDFLFVSIFDCNIVGLTLWKAYQEWRSGMSRHRLGMTIYRDGVIYFFVLFMISIANVVVLNVQRNTLYYDLLVLFQRVVYSLLASRVVINVRKVASDLPHNASSLDRVALSTIENGEIMETRPPWNTGVAITTSISTHVDTETGSKEEKWNSLHDISANDL